MKDVEVDFELGGRNGKSKKTDTKFLKLKLISH